MHAPTCCACQLGCFDPLCDVVSGDLHPEAALIRGLVQPCSLDTVTPVDGEVVQMKKKDVTKGHASNYVATDPSHGGTQPARKGADRTNSILRKACHAHSEVVYMCQAGCMPHSIKNAHAAYRLGQGQGEPLAQPDLDDTPPPHSLQLQCRGRGSRPQVQGYLPVFEYLGDGRWRTYCLQLCVTLLVICLSPT